MLYDAKCPVCGKLNKDMYLEETEGRFVCDKCGSEIEIPRFKKPKRIPIYDSRTLVALIIIIDLGKSAPFCRVK